MDRRRLLDRFLRYVRIETTANDATDRYPSSEGQWTLGKLLVEEAQQMGYASAHQDEHGLVWIEIPSKVSHPVPTIAFNAHLDTSPETTAANVKPQVIERYAGGDIVLPGDPTKVICAADNPDLDACIGRTIITTDGTTLLGGDDKAGVAILMELACTLRERDDLRHGPIRILFTCDEEIGRGVQHVDFAKLGATACYTLDGGGANDVDVETFSADLAIVRCHGVNIHPSIAKGRMVNALRVAGDFLAELPIASSPERTAGREGFLHPYVLEGGVALVTLRVLLRDFDTPRLQEHADLLREIASRVESAHPGSQIEVEIRQQYRNLGDGLRHEPRAVAYAVEAHRRLGRTAKRAIIRGGTDGSLMK